MTGAYRAAQAVFLLGLLPLSARACGFIEEGALLHTFSDEARQSKLILVGKFADAGPGAMGTDLIISRVIRSHPALGNRKVLRLPRHVPIPDPKDPPTYLVFAEVTEGEVDPYRGVPATEALVRYLEGALPLGGPDRRRLLRYCFDYLEHPDQAIALDAYTEFMKTRDPDLAVIARDLSLTKLHALLRNPRTPATRLRMYAFLLANRGSKPDTVLLRAVLDRLSRKAEVPNIDGVLTGYILLAPEEGRTHLEGILRDPSRSFMLRWSALRAVRFFYNTRPDVVSRKEAAELMSLLLDHEDMLDLPVDQLRRWKCWTFTARILALTSTEGGRLPIARRNILRYALESPAPAAASFVARQRKDDPELVKDCEESLELEKGSPRR